LVRNPLKGIKKIEMKKILIAEDSSVIQNLIKRVLNESSNNYEFKTVKNGEALLSSVEKENYDLLLVDVNMPKVNGIECVKRVRAGENENANIPILAITGNADNLTEDEYKELGFSGLITKPINFDQLVATVGSMMGE